MSASDGDKFRGGLASAMTNMKGVQRWAFLTDAGSDMFTLVGKALTEYRRLSSHALGAREQTLADAWLINELRESCRHSLDDLMDEMP